MPHLNALVVWIEKNKYKLFVTSAFTDFYIETHFELEIQQHNQVFINFHGLLSLNIINSSKTNQYIKKAGGN